MSADENKTKIMQNSVESFINALESYRGRDKVVSLYLHRQHVNNTPVVYMY